jgi:hypothetical protein
VRTRARKTPPSSAYGASWKARKRLRRGDFPQAAEGTRTLDLLHGKQSTMTKFGHVLPANAAVPGIDPCKGVVGFVAFCRGCVNQSSTASSTLDCPCLADGLTNVSGSPQALRRRRGPGECVATPLHGKRKRSVAFLLGCQRCAERTSRIARPSHRASGRRLTSRPDIIALHARLRPQRGVARSRWRSQRRRGRCP